MTKEERNNLLNENLRAMRIADWQRWQSLDFVVGYEIHLSKDNKNHCDICQRLQGKYPKSFYWHGWCNDCKCMVIPILADFYSQEASDDRVNEMKAALFGTQYKKYVPKETIKFVPLAFIEWFVENHASFTTKENTPYFVTQNTLLISQSYEYYKNQGQ